MTRETTVAKSENFGEISGKRIRIGDLVEWSSWNSDKDNWDKSYGIVLKIKNVIRSNRLITIARVASLSNDSQELEFFTMGLRLVSSSKNRNLNVKIDN